MSDDGSTDERSALGWVMSGTVGALVVGGLAKHLLDRRRDRTLAEAAVPEPPSEDAEDADQTEEAGLEEAEGHPS